MPRGCRPRLALSVLLHLAALAAAAVMKSKRQRCGGPLGLDHPALNSTTTECQAYRRVCFDQVSSARVCRSSTTEIEPRTRHRPAAAAAAAAALACRAA